MIKQLSIIFFGVIFSYQVKAQFKIEGFLFDELNNPIEAGAIILRLQNSGKLIASSTSDTNGRFMLNNIPKGRYQLEISYLGFLDDVRTIYLENSISLNKITLKPDEESLDEVIIKSEKPLTKSYADKKVFNADKLITGIGGSAFQLLSKTPGIIIDNNGNIIIEGKTGVRVYINGKPSLYIGEALVAYLNSLQASEIKSIETITQPSAKFEAEGNAGVINILLKKEVDFGLRGNVNTVFSYGDFGRWNNAINISNNSEKFFISASYNNFIGKELNFLSFESRQNNELFESRTDAYISNDIHTIRLTADYKLSKNNTLGILFSNTSTNTIEDSESKTFIKNIPSLRTNQVLVGGFDANTDISNWLGNLNFKRTVVENYEISLDLDLGHYSSYRDNIQPNVFYDANETLVQREIINRIVSPVDIAFFSAKMDFMKELSEGKISTGFRISKVHTENQFDFFNRLNNDDILNFDRSNTFDYDETISAAYFDFSKNITSKLHYQLGLRAEYTNSTGNLKSLNDQDVENKRDYLDLFPNAMLSYEFENKRKLSLGYNRRIQRPNYQNLNPFEYPLDELRFFKGNAFLKPQYTNVFSLSYIPNKHFSTSISYAETSDFSALVTELLAGNQTVTIARNIANQNTLSLGFSYNKKVAEWWRLTSSVNVLRMEFETYSDSFIGLERNSLNMSLQNSFNLSDKWSAEVSGWYNSPFIWGGSFLTRSQGVLNIAIQTKLLNDNLILSLTGEDLLFTDPWRSRAQFDEVSVVSNGGFDSRQIRFSLLYNFGNSNVKMKNRETEGEKEQSRIIN